MAGAVAVADAFLDAYTLGDDEALLALCADARVDLCSIYTVRDGQIVEYHDYG